MASKDPQIRAIEVEADRLSRLDGKTSKKERFRIRNELRADAGLGKEKKKRGGVAGLYDRNKSWAIPAATALAGLATGGLATPIAAGALAGGLDREGKGGIGFDLGGAARGALSGAATGGLGVGLGRAIPALAGPNAALGGAAGGAVATPPIAGGSAPMAPAPAQGFFGKTMDWLKGPQAENLLKLGTGAYGVYQQGRGLQMAEDAAKADRARWAAGAPLREAGMEGLLNPMPVDTSSLNALAGQGNPFARRGPPVPGAGTLAGNAADERPGLQTQPIPATAMRRY